MSMKKIRMSVAELTKIELEMANKNFPMFASDHEAYAVIKEEFEETEANLKTCYGILERIWVRVKNDGNLFDLPEELREMAELTACEAIQVAAMAQKMIDSRANRTDADNETCCPGCDWEVEK